MPGQAKRITYPAPQPKQREFMVSKQLYTAYGGARGGGKSWALRLKLHLLCLKNSGIRCLLLRRSYAELKENHVRELIPLTSGVATYNDTDKIFKYKNGSAIKLGYCDSENDVLHFQGQEYDIIAMDEATQFTEYQFQVLKACLRGANPFPKRFYLTCNPGGVGHAWVKRLFIDREYKNGENGDDYKFIRATVYDNPKLIKSSPAYVNMLETLPEDTRRAWLNGEWDVFEGQFFPEFSRDIHVCEPFEIPDGWTRYRALDYGLDMLAFLYIAVDYEGNVYVYREGNEPNLVATEAAKTVLSYQGEDEKIYCTFVPPDLKGRQRDTGKSILDLFHDGGLCDLVLADNSKESGWACVKEYMRPYEVPEQERPGELKKVAKIRIFSSCSRLIKNIPLIQHDKKYPNVCATEPHDITHNLDALRYFCVSRPVVPVEKVTESELDKYRKRVLSGSHARRKQW